jgi:hypothetical protein
VAAEAGVAEGGRGCVAGLGAGVGAGVWANAVDEAANSNDRAMERNGRERI